jgi:hypothetical protein
MQIRLTVTRTQGSRQSSADVVVTAQPGAKLSSVAQSLRNAAGVTAPGRLFAGLDPLEDEAPLGRPFLVDGARLWLDTPGTPATLTGILALHVVSGPDAGGVHLLTPKDDGFGGELPIRIGRGADADIRIDDPDISRLHAELLVRHDRDSDVGRVYVRDLGSTNGITLDGGQVGGTPAELRPGSLLRIGESSIALSIDSGGVPELPVRADGSGHVDVGRIGWNRRPVDPPQIRIDLPARPPEKGRASARRAAMEQYEALRYDADRRIAAALTSEARLRRDASPDPATLLVAAVRPDARLWERRPGDADFLRLRFGTAALPSNVMVVGGKAVQPRVPTVPVTLDLPACGVVGLVGPRPELARLARFAVAQAAGAHSPKDVEIVLLAPEVMEDPGTAHAGEEHWRWTRWLPHLKPEDGQDCGKLLGLGPEQAAARLAELVRRIRARRGRPMPPAPGVVPVPDSGRAVLVVIDPIVPLAGSADLKEVLSDGPSAGIFTLCLADRSTDLPPQTRAMITLGGEVNSRLRIDMPNSAPVEGAVADMVSVAWADRFARALAPLRDKREAPATPHDQTRIQRVPAPALPEEVRLLELLGLDLLTPAKLSARWDALRSAKRVVLGTAADGPLAVDPAHLLIGGGSGSGVSELVRSIVCGQAATNHPDELDIALVSAGPGKSLAGCEDLPHVFEYVDADADGSEALDRLVRRLEYELDQREWPPGKEVTVAELGTGSPSEAPAEAAAAAETTPPRLLLAVDNLTALTATHPTFVEALATLAERGKKFGLRVVIGVTPHESGLSAIVDAAAFVEALKTPVCAAADLRVAMHTANNDAARILVGAIGVLSPTAGSGNPAVIPGRGQAKLPNGSVVPFQAASVSSPMASSATPSNRPTVKVQDWHELGERLTVRRSVRTDADAGPTDLSLLIGALKKAAD